MADGDTGTATATEEQVETASTETTQDGATDQQTDTGADESQKAGEMRLKSPLESDEAEQKGDEQASDKGADTNQDNANEGAYTLTVPEGVEVNEEAMTGFKEWASKHKLTQEAFQEAAEMHFEQVRAQQRQADETFAAWHAESSKMDPGDIARARSAVDKFADDEAKQMLLSQPVGYHPAILRLLAKVGAAMQEGKPIEGKGAAEPGKPQDRLYPTMKKG